MQREAFEIMAHTWKNSEKVMRFARRLMKKYLNLQNPRCILDIGCGKGVIIPVLKDFYPCSEVIALDFSYSMLSGIEGCDCKKVQAKASALPISDNTVDLAVVMNAFPHFPEKQKFFREAHRVLKPGGFLCIIHSMDRKRLNRLHRSIGGVMKEVHMPDKRTLFSMMKEAGFTELFWHENKGIFISGMKQQ